MKEFSTMDACEVTTMHCGGTIARLYEPDNEEQLKELLSRLDSFIVIGGGSNMIFSDSTISTPVIRLGKGFGHIDHQEDILSVGASISTAGMLGYCIRNALSGLEYLAGMPGTVGGALCMNAGTPEKGIMDSVLVVDYMDRSGLHSAARKDLPYTYRKGGFPPDAVVTGVRLDVTTSTSEQVRSAIEAQQEKRRSQPRGYSCGSVFKNPAGSAAGYLIDKAGMKGYRIGGAKVSEIHANFIINDANATTADIKALISTIKEQVKVKFGIELQEEVRIVD